MMNHDKILTAVLLVVIATGLGFIHLDLARYNETRDNLHALRLDLELGMSRIREIGPELERSLVEINRLKAAFDSARVELRLNQRSLLVTRNEIRKQMKGVSRVNPRMEKTMVDIEKVRGELENIKGELELIKSQLPR